MKHLRDIVLFTLDFLHKSELIKISVLEKEIFFKSPPVFSLGICKIKNCLLNPIQFPYNSLFQFYHSLEITNPSLGSLQNTIRKFPNVSRVKLIFQKTIVPIIKETKKKKIKLNKNILFSFEIEEAYDIEYIKHFLSYLKY